jgi:cytochrome P450
LISPGEYKYSHSFNGLRFLGKSNMTAQQKAAYMPFGGGSRVCIGLHLAWMELRFGAALFFDKVVAQG